MITLVDCKDKRGGGGGETLDNTHAKDLRWGSPLQAIRACISFCSSFSLTASKPSSSCSASAERNASSRSSEDMRAREAMMGMKGDYQLISSLMLPLLTLAWLRLWLGLWSDIPGGACTHASSLYRDTFRLATRRESCSEISDKLSTFASNKRICCRFESWKDAYIVDILLIKGMMYVRTACWCMNENLFPAGASIHSLSMRLSIAC